MNFRAPYGMNQRWNCCYVVLVNLLCIVWELWEFVVLLVFKVWFRNWSDQFDVQITHKMLNLVMYRLAWLNWFWGFWG